MREIIWINGKIVKRKDAKVSIFDHGFLYGDGLFETMRAYEGRVYRITEHLDRLCSAAKALSMKVPYGKKFLKAKISRLADKLKADNAYVRVAVTRGEGKVGLNPALCKKQNIIVLLYRFKPYPASGINAIISSVRREAMSLLANIKSNNYLPNVLALTEARKRGADDAIMLNREGYVAECAASNIFMIKGNKLITPKIGEGLLPGITRKVIIGFAPKLGLKALEKRIGVPELERADEVFLTNSIAEVRGVASINGKRISKGKAGPVTGLLHKLYQRSVRKELGLK